jgi:hypothetical protein
MGKRVPEVIVCPNCDTPAEIKRVSVVHVDENGKEKVGTMRRLNCPTCRRELADRGREHEKEKKHKAEVADRAAQMRAAKKKKDDLARAKTVAVVKEEMPAGSRVTITGARKRANRKLINTKTGKPISLRTVIRHTKPPEK